MPSYALAETQVGVDDDVTKKIANAVEIRVKERNGIIQQQKTGRSDSVSWHHSSGLPSLFVYWASQIYWLIEQQGDGWGEEKQDSPSMLNVMMVTTSTKSRKTDLEKEIG